MKKIAFLSIVSLAFLSVSCRQSQPEPQDPEVTAVKALAARVLDSKADSFTFKTVPSEKDFFTLQDEEGRICIKGNNANSMAVGLNHYLKYYCNVEYGWLVSDSFKLPRRLPKVGEPVTAEARVDKRFFLNYCTFGYSMPWWTWKDWEHFIDWMALNGVNLPLAITGQESIWYQIWTEMGLTDEEVRSYFTGPAHLPWHRMQNIDRWGGPLPQCWLDGQLELQKQITARERELNMKPVLPAFAGHVPRELARIRPDAPITQLKAWCGYSDEYACSFLDPMSELYKEIQKKFIEKETEIYGTDHVYGIDIFNEVTPPSWDAEYLGRVSRQVYESLEEADPEATWLQMGWLFYNASDNWTADRVKSYLTSFPLERQLMLDYYCERQEVWQRTDSFFGVPYIWCYLGNFGGNTFLAGQLDEINSRIENTFENGGANFQGIGCTLEGLDCNPFVYEYVLEKAWDLPAHKDLKEWTRSLADQRVGKADAKGREAWALLVDSVYRQATRSGQSPYLNVRPSFGESRSYCGNNSFNYDNSTLAQAIGKLLEADGRNTAYDFDLTNLTRQWLSNRFAQLKVRYEEAYARSSRDTMQMISSEMLQIIKDIDGLVGSQTYFLVGKWIDDARSWGNTPEEKLYFEKNARNVLTTWSDGDMVLNDYAARTWNGLTGNLYYGRWEMFFRHVEARMDKKLPWDEEAYQEFHKEVTQLEKDWWDKTVGEYSAKPAGDSKTIVKALFKKYKDRI